MSKLDENCKDCGVGQKLKCLVTGREDEKVERLVPIQKLSKPIKPCEYKKLQESDKFNALDAI